MPLAPALAAALDSQIRAHLDTSAREVTLRIASTSAKANHAGMFHSSAHLEMADMAMAEVFGEFADKIARDSIEAIERSIAHVGPGSVDPAEALALVSAPLATLADQCRQGFHSAEQRLQMARTWRTGHLDSRVNTATMRLPSQAAVACFPRPGQVPPAGSTITTINGGTIGAVHTGRGDISHVSQQVTVEAPSMAELAAALAAIRVALDNASNIEPGTKVEVLEVVRDAELEVIKPAPNKTRLRGLLTSTIPVAGRLVEVGAALTTLIQWVSAAL